MGTRGGKDKKKAASKAAVEIENPGPTDARLRNQLPYGGGINALQESSIRGKRPVPDLGFASFDDILESIRVDYINAETSRENLQILSNDHDEQITLFLTRESQFVSRIMVLSDRLKEFRKDYEDLKAKYFAVTAELLAKQGIVKPRQDSEFTQLPWQNKCVCG